MNRQTTAAIFCLLAVAGCDKPGAEVTVEETRPMTSRDTKPKLFATSDERFRNAKPSPVRGMTPEGWLVLPASEFRLLNYRFGASGLGEVWVTLVSGTVIDNVNRWVGEFGGDPLDGAAFGGLRTVPVAGARGVWVEAAGEYKSVMSTDPRPGFALRGVVADLGGRILTVKMVGPESEVAAESEALERYAASLVMAE
jgi:hypothetical protein